MIFGWTLVFAYLLFYMDTTVEHSIQEISNNSSMPGSINMDETTSTASKKDVKVKQEAGLSTLASSSIGFPSNFGNARSISRLPSFKGPRDLTLSSSVLKSSSIQSPVSRTKKHFVPNIPLRKEKGDKIASKSEKSSPKNTKAATRGREDSGRQKKHNQREFVQTRGSLFGDGIAFSTSKGLFKSSNYNIRSGNESAKKSINEVQKPVLNPNGVASVDKDFEEKRLKELLRDDFIDDPEMYISPQHCPVRLPLLEKEMEYSPCNDSIKVEKDSESHTSFIPLGAKIKMEPKEEEDDESLHSITKVKNVTDDDGEFSKPSWSAFEANSVADIITRTHLSDVLFIQMPSSLPGHPPEAGAEVTVPGGSSDQHGPIKEQRNAKSDSSSLGGEDSRCHWSALPEGRIGTFKVYNSGRVDLCLGENHTLQVCRGTEVGFLQRAVRVQTNDESRSGSMVVMGNVVNRLLCTPDFEGMVRRRVHGES